jgi:DNA-binding NarL/FixJ family response regulator
VLKAAADRDLIEACRAAMRGEPFVYPSGLTALAAEQPLTAREMQIVTLIAEGHTSREIAGMLVLSEHTVERHRERILDKLGLRDRVALTRYAIRHRLIEP